MKPGVCCSPARPATSGAGCCASSSSPGDPSAAWLGDPRRYSDGSPTTPRSLAATSSSPALSALRSRVSPRPTTSCIRWLHRRPSPRRIAGAQRTLQPRHARAASEGSSTSEASVRTRSSPRTSRAATRWPDPARVGRPDVEFRASIIIGSGSLSFEIVRGLVDRSPVLLMPRWVVSRTQPIAIEDVLEYLLAALDLEVDESPIFEIGGPDRVTYADLMREYARQASLRRALIRVPLATPRVSALWLSIVTPLYGNIGRELVESLRNDTLVCGERAREVFPIRPRGFRRAIERALVNEGPEVRRDPLVGRAFGSPRTELGRRDFRPAMISQPGRLRN